MGTRLRAAIIIALVGIGTGATSARAQLPENLVASPSTHSVIALSWDDAGADSYDVYRWSGSSWTHLGNTTGLIWGDFGLSENTAYAYQVEAICGGVACDTPPFTFAWTRLKAATGQSRSASNSSGASAISVTLSWNDQTTLETSYVVQRKFEWESGYTTIATLGACTSNPCTWTDTKATGALDWARVNYRVQAKSSTNTSTFTTMSQLTTRWGKTSQEWCSGIAVRPEIQFTDTSPCVPRYSLQDLADDADLALMGSDLLSTENPGGVPDWPMQCQDYWGAEDVDIDLDDTQASRADFINAVHDLQSPGDAPVRFMYFSRFDFVAARLMMYPTFDASWLVETATPYDDIVDFFAEDASEGCQSGSPPTIPSLCSFVDKPAGLGSTWDNFTFHVLIDDLEGVSDAYEDKVYYIPASHYDTEYYPYGVMANQLDPDYREFRVIEAADAVDDAGWDFINLNHKLHFYKPGAEFWPLAFDDVADINQDETGVVWSAEPDGYGYEEYVLGWGALASDLDTAEVPVAVLSSPFFWPRNTFTGNIDVNGGTESDSDDSSTVGTNEAEVIRDVARGADLVLLERTTNPLVTESAFLDVVAELREAGAEVIAFSTDTGACAP